MKRKGWECHPKPEDRLAQQPKKTRFSKSHAAYQTRAAKLTDGWPEVASGLSEARRFHDDFESAVKAP
jgi:hypothetical protein